MHQFPDSAKLAAEEQRISCALRFLNLELDSALRQKEKMQWIHLGDENTKFFHQNIKHHQRINRIACLYLNGKDINDPSLIQHKFHRFYTNLVCADFDRAKINLNIARNGPILSDAQRGSLDLSFSKEEIKVALWSIPDDKAHEM